MVYARIFLSELADLEAGSFSQAFAVVLPSAVDAVESYVSI